MSGTTKRLNDLEDAVLSSRWAEPEAGPYMHVGDPWDWSALSGAEQAEMAELAERWLTPQQVYRYMRMVFLKSAADLNLHLGMSIQLDIAPGPVVPAPGESETQAVTLAIWQMAGLAVNPFLALMTAPWPAPPDWDVDEDMLAELRQLWLAARANTLQICEGAR